MNFRWLAILLAVLLVAPGCQRTTNEPDVDAEDLELDLEPGVETDDPTDTTDSSDTTDQTDPTDTTDQTDPTDQTDTTDATDAATDETADGPPAP